MHSQCLINLLIASRAQRSLFASINVPVFVALRFASHDILIEKAQRKVESKKWQPPPELSLAKTKMQ
jgi:hypothetical protein